MVCKCGYAIVTPLVCGMHELLVSLHFFSGMPLLECCCVDHTSPERTVVGLPPGWVDPSVVYQHLDPPQPGGTWAPLRSSAMKWWLKWCTNDWVVILLVIWSCHVPKEMELTPWNKRRNWRTTSSLLTLALVTYLVYGIRRILQSDYVSKASDMAGLFDSSKLWTHTSAPRGNIGLSAIASRWLHILSLLSSLTIILVFLHQTAWWNSGSYL